MSRPRCWASAASSASASSAIARWGAASLPARSRAEPPAGDMRRGMPRFSGDNLRHNLALLAEFRRIAAAEGCTPAQLALAWLLSRGQDVVPIVSSSRRERLEENAAAVGAGAVGGDAGGGGAVVRAG